MNKKDSEIRLAVMAEQLETIQRDVKEIKTRMDGEYITHVEFEPIKKLVYGMVGLILTIVLSALVYMVIIR